MIRAALDYLPEKIAAAILGLSPQLRENICEIRLRRNLPLSLTTLKGNIFISPKGRVCPICDSIRVTSAEIDITAARLCEGSVYRYMETISLGYIVTKHGIRAGICGEYAKQGNSVSNFTAINIRIPRILEGISDSVARYFLEKRESLLIFSPPGVGKTTYIRSLAICLSSGQLGSPVRVAVIDERGEILPSVEDSFGIIDRLCGYSKPQGMEIATRLLSPELIICDEIGISDEIDAIMSVQNSGIPLIATTHALSLDGLLRRPIIKKLVERGVFESLIMLTRQGSQIDTIFCNKDLEKQ